MLNHRFCIQHHAIQAMLTVLMGSPGKNDYIWYEGDAVCCTYCGYCTVYCYMLCAVHIVATALYTVICCVLFILWLLHCIQLNAVCLQLLSSTALNAGVAEFHKDCHNPSVTVIQ